LPVRAFEAPGALGCKDSSDILRRSNPDIGWEYTEADGRALGIRRLWGYEGQQASAPFLGDSSLNLAYAYVEQPMVYETFPSAKPRGLAAVSLVRPAPFEPEREFDKFAVSVENERSYHVTFPDGETAFVVLGNEPPHIEYRAH